MCGLFGFSGAHSLSSLQTIARQASQRGTHAHGAQWATGRIAGAGRWDGALDQLEQVSGAWCVGAGRMATFGTWRDPVNNQPLTVGNVTLVHNGNLYGAEEWRRAHAPDYTPLTQTDTELIALALSRGMACDDLPHGVAVALIWHVHDEPGLHVYRTAHPLYIATVDGCTYASSKAWHRACELVPYDTEVII